MVRPCLKRICVVAVFTVKRSMALLMTRGIRSCRKSTVSRLISPKTSGQRFCRKYFLRGRKFLNVSVKGREEIFMGKEIIKQDMGCQ
jgi:hypothetical protein